MLFGRYAVYYIGELLYDPQRTDIMLNLSVPQLLDIRTFVVRRSSRDRQITACCSEKSARTAPTTDGASEEYVHLALHICSISYEVQNSIRPSSLGLYLTTMSQSQPPRPPLNIPSGSSQITPDPEPLKPDETLSGDKIRDFKAAVSVRQLSAPTNLRETLDS